ncbi:tRNA (N(6)-L-threonylcarbamoyladenosine(37)-C(2))-methylthiotransferase MtaB [Desulforhopalus vacuolatus]|uniref:tRNA (N(6)-L-threonylcarbamoyladenosine(37)-C(2))- methylthiotransferase MtaB n=1 Tax=Desulforhopalus vacuolatus TaxID=40414 RepID=UPI0019663430|nr:tRNA (N(6)-L-threonylcarbamoyladenosine(37)-C(2))-methylthiotransferase MtaB [Desulforhopalus vacuolatus]MBM9520499.1 tRNA (N(6)-L-threonylcarbamoyladenosine(37)-C(2))-methylthiotransferase MtaB [Desulforhopalus vacuolatus]
MKKAIITTLGCKVNQLESAAISAALENAGITVSSEKNIADIVILNTCTVTAHASAQSRQKLRHLLRKNPAADIYITGCHAEEAHEELKKMEELHGRNFSIYGNNHKDSLIANAIAGTHHSDVGNIMQAREITRLPMTRFARRTRAYLRIQDGCNAFCSYCIVPYTRGPGRSLPVAEVVEQARAFAASGHIELVLTGIHLGLYGADLKPQENLVSLLDVLTARLPQLRFRISSLEPVEIDNALLSLMAERSGIQPHLHIPLQSGCDAILKAMNRRYTTAQFQEIIENCHRRIPGLAIGIDILAGFPGETEADFAREVQFLESLEFTYLHVFPYSIRPGTRAAELPNQVPQAEKDRRSAILRKLSGERKQAFYKSQLGTVHPVFFEGKRDHSGYLKGFTDNYVDVRAIGDDSRLRSRVKTRLNTLEDGIVHGEIIP